MTTRGVPLALVFALIYVLAGLTIGWRVAYDVVVHITSPADTAVPSIAYALSIVGWLMVPGVAGAVAGYVVSHSIESRRRTPLADLFPADEESVG